MILWTHLHVFVISIFYNLICFEHIYVMTNKYERDSYKLTGN